MMKIILQAFENVRIGVRLLIDKIVNEIMKLFKSKE